MKRVGTIEAVVFSDQHARYGHLAQQDASTLTGQELSALRWNEANGRGGIEVWGYAPDVERARAAGSP